MTATANNEKVAVALAFSETFLAETPEELNRKFDDLCVRFPEFCDPCDEILQAWRDQTAMNQIGEVMDVNRPQTIQPTDNATH